MRKQTDESPIWCCKECGKTNVEVKVWADANTDEVLDGDVCDKNDTWCRDCEDHTGIMLLSEFKEQQENE